ncbi:aldehyde dehydrogenase family protein [Saccharopolyspora spinosa]|uniref:Acyl-CoA reductase-like NAD-dependent aldehyde dehydrogenase n=1 Tax=Saccharopolyspora spinosa TaxID=60894 RepID=A0A2N3XVC8_SACSN|nr:aldehyde dehydrogenase family protein [Saccharopolyspora spinosa]PKW14570.1 acyl-CoA reductase-like NAD-dependent aldehyde dehydrogenase [Saccharopolyspora spinosa]
MSTTNPTELVLPTKGLTGLLVAGSWVQPAAGRTFTVENPSRREVIIELGQSGPQDVDRAVSAAKSAFPAWKTLASRTRGAALTALAERVAGHAEDIARVLSAESGNALRTQSRGEVHGAAEVLRYYGATAAEQKGETLPLGPGLFSYSTREPLGVVGAIIPWNSPVVLAAVKIGMALATGNTLVLKPAEDAPLAVLRIAELATEVVPAGVLNVVTGPGSVTGAALAEHPEVAKVSFTGSSEVGRSVSHAAADRIARVTLELGGKSPSIVFPDAVGEGRDVDALVANLVSALRFARQGQSCTAGSRLFLHESVWDEVVPKLVAAVEALTVGDALDETSDVGAVINVERYEEIRSFLAEAADKGAVFATGEVPPPADQVAGLHPKPVIITDVDNTWRIARDEVFGPVLVVIPWADEDDVVAQANDTDYGLAAFVFTHDVGTALRVTTRLDAGWIQVNQAGGQVPGMSYGGVKQSGIGSEYSIEGALESYTTRKSVTIRVP